MRTPQPPARGPDTGASAARPFLVRTAAPLAAIGAGAVALGYVGAVDPNRPGRFPACPVAAFTGLSCPGCGGLRSAHALVHGELTAALSANALAVVVLAALAVAALGWLLRAALDRPGARSGARSGPRRRSGPRWPTGRFPALAAALLVAAFTLVRNLPAGAALAP